MFSSCFFIIGYKTCFLMFFILTSMFFTTMILLRLTTDGHKTSRNSRATCYYCIIYVMYFFWINKDETGWDVTSEESASAYQNGPIVCQAWHNSGAILTVQRRRVQYRDRGICKSPLATRCMRAMSNITRQPFTRSHLADECTYCQGRRKLSGRYGGRHTNPERWWAAPYQ